MKILAIDDKVEFGSKNRLAGTIVGHGTMKTPGGSTVPTYAVRLDKQFQGYLDNGSFISTMLICADGVTKAEESKRC